MRRVSSPLCGATSSATAAPVSAPSTNAVMMVPAPLSSLMVCLYQMLTRTFRNFFGSFRMSASRFCISVIVRFMLS